MKEFLKDDALLIAIGNSGRQDDGLGWAFADAFVGDTYWDGRVHYRYQLQIEDADLIANTSQVIFVDAFKGELSGGFALEKCEPSTDFSFSTHALAPETVLALCRDLYDKTPEAWILKIQGLEWALETGLTPVARHNLEAALVFFGKGK